MSEYNHKDIEAKWQKKWGEDGLYTVTENVEKEKCYVLDMFPYPSGEGLHVGHPKGYIATDVYSRHQQMRGKQVLHPMGWDAFGLPAENFALKNKVHPRVAVEKNIERFKEQLARIGFNYDWSREINTTDPTYYKWTQWIFVQLFKKGLAYESHEPINWCPSCKTGLANEDLEDGACERCGSEIEKKPLRQWVLRITDYADRLLEDLTLLPDWPESIKESQRNWIGKSDGLLFRSPVKGMDLVLETFSTHFEAFCADTFLVIAPDHPLLAELIAGTDREEEVLAKAREMVVRRQQNKYDEKEVEGIFTGRYTIDPVGNGELPIWVASYALADYGTGIVKCSAHDERDFAFAKKYDIPLKEVLEPVLMQTDGTAAFKKDMPFEDNHGVIVLIKHWEEEKYLGLRWPEIEWGTLLTGNCEKGEDPTDTVLREIREETGYTSAAIACSLGRVHSKYYHAAKGINRFGHTEVFYVELADGAQENVSAKEDKKHERVWLTEEEMRDFLTAVSHRYVFDKVTQDLCWTDMNLGVLNEPEVFKGRVASDVREEIMHYAEEKSLATRKTMYRLNDWVFSRQRYWGEPIPIIHCDKCGPVAVPEEDLPVVLPEVESYEPTGTGESPLADIDEWVNTTCPSCGGAGKRETNTMPQWAGSSWYYLRYMDAHNDAALVDSKNEKYWAPVDMYVGGAEHATRHLIYARFWHKFLYDIGVVSTKEPFMELHSVGLIQAEDGRKMSKRWGNVINPDDIVDRFGADSLRVYEMFMGPFDAAIAWNTDGLVGARRFLERVWRMQGNLSNEPSDSTERELHRTIKKVTEDIDRFKFNTAIAQMMTFVNVAEKEGVSRDQYVRFIQLLAPFAPHVTEELWSTLGGEGSVHVSTWPSYDEAKLINDTVTIAIQVNGKVRATCEVAVGSTQEVVEPLAREAASKWLSESPKKTIFVVNRLINFVL